MAPPMNLLLNPGFGFHSLERGPAGAAASFCSGAVACWDQDAYRDAEVYRAPRVTAFRPRFPVDNVVVIHPGKQFSQFMLLAEAGLDPGDRISLSVFGHQSAPRSLRAAIHMMQVDDAPGEWSPAAFGQQDKRTFAKCTRGELTPVPGAEGTCEAAGDFELKIENITVTGAFPQDHPPGGAPAPQAHRPWTIGITVEFTNVSEKDAWIYSPCLSQGPRALNRLPEARRLPTFYRNIPRTMQKLWLGEPLYILHLGYSSDRGDANPPLYLYDENPKSPTFKQPLQQLFDGAKVGHPEWNDYIPSWSLYFMGWGRMRCGLLRKFDYPMSRILLNIMACGGSFVSEAHSGYAEYASLSIPPGPANGHRAGKTWQELCPEIFSRPEGPVPDLVTFGYGIKCTPEGVDEIEQFEGAIRWFQRHYPNVEFIFCINDWREGVAHNASALMELSLRYQIPFLNFGRTLNLVARHCALVAPVPGDGHLQAYAHYLWFKELERAFEAVDPLEPGIAQVRLPERLSPYTLGWEGDVRTYSAPHPRIRKGLGFILDDTVVNLWATCKDERVQISVDGKPVPGVRSLPMARRDSRNSTFAAGRLSLGDRHIVEVAGNVFADGGAQRATGLNVAPGRHLPIGKNTDEARMVAVDAKTAPDRQWFGIESPRWRLGDLRPRPFESQWGAPYGSPQVAVPAGKSVETEVAGTFLSIAYADQPEGGTLCAQVDGKDGALSATANMAFHTAGGEARYIEDRKGTGPFPYGMHSIRITAVNGPVALLGVFSYDTRANRAAERLLRGTACPGESVSFCPPFKARPLVFCTGGLRVLLEGVSAVQVKFGGERPGAYEIVGE